VLRRLPQRLRLLPVVASTTTTTKVPTPTHATAHTTRAAPARVDAPHRLPRSTQPPVAAAAEWTTTCSTTTASSSLPTKLNPSGQRVHVQWGASYRVGGHQSPRVPVELLHQRPAGGPQGVPKSRGQGQMNKNRAIYSTRKDATGELAGFFIALLFFGAAERPRHKRDCRHHRAPSWYGHLNPEFTSYVCLRSPAPTCLLYSDLPLHVRKATARSTR
jgi:hypothetical protein